MSGPKFGLCVTAIIKNEAPYVEEWICHHRALGVDHFFIFDNNSEDRIDDVLKPYLTHGVATLIRWPMLGGQIDAYNYAMHFFGHVTEWMAYIDLDEFIVLKDTATIPEFLATLEGADQVLIPWRSFGFSGHRTKPPGLVTENYTVAQDIPPEGFARVNAKAIVRTSAAKRVTAHFAFTTSQATVDERNKRVPEDFYLQAPSFERAQINHYYTKSYEEFEAKLARGQGDNGAEKGRIPFDRPGFNTRDRSALRHLETTRKQLALMGSLSSYPFRYGSQRPKGAPLPRDPFSWGAQVALSNYLADTPTLRLNAPMAFDNLAKGGNMMVARASDHGRLPLLGALRNSIHVRDLVRRLGDDIVFDLAGDNDSRVALSPAAVLERSAESILLKRPSEGVTLSANTGRHDKSCCYCIAYALRTADPLRLQVGVSSLDDAGKQPAAKEIDMPSAGYYCGIVELNREPVRASDLRVTFPAAAGQTEIFDLFAVAYG
jgi:hypothetical protein